MLFRVALRVTSESLHPGEVVLMKKGNTEVTEPAVLFSKPCFPAFPSSFPQAELVPSLVFLEKLLAAHLEGFYSQPCVTAQGWGQNLSMPLSTGVRTCEKQFPRCTKDSNLTSGLWEAFFLS